MYKLHRRNQKPVLTITMIDKTQHIQLQTKPKKINLLLLGTHGFAKTLGFLITMSQTKSKRLLIITISQNGGTYNYTRTMML